jgi:CubicO group peptidase (beta-lactamase class C family)
MRSCVLLAVTIGLALVTGCGGSSPITDAAAKAQQVNALFEQKIQPGAPGCAAGVYRDGEIVFSGRYGVTPAAFNLGSLSKPFTTLAALLLEKRRQLSMDDDVRRWVPELLDHDPKIRVRDLIQHTSGLRDYGTLEVLSGKPVKSMPDFVALMSAQRAFNFEPGTRHEYSHSDYGVLGLIVERVAGVPFGVHLKQTVFEPLGMKGTFVKEGTFGGDNVHSTIDDLARWDGNLAKGTVGGAATIERMLSRPKLWNGETIPYAYGLRLGTYRGLRIVSRGGHAPGTRTEFIRFRDKAVTVTALCNGDDLDAKRFAEGVADIYLGAEMTSVEPRPSVPTGTQASPEELARYAGWYGVRGDAWSWWPIEVRNGVLGEVLFHPETDEEFFPMTPMASTTGGGQFFEIGRTGNVGIFTFMPGSSDSMRLNISWNGAPAGTFDRRREWRLSPNDAAQYAGRWFNPDLGVVWQIQWTGGRVVLKRDGRRDLTLRYVDTSRFLRAFGPDDEATVLLEFNRGSTRAVTGLTVSTRAGEDSVRGLKFSRQ